MKTITSKVPVSELLVKMKLLQRASPDAEYYLVHSDCKDDDGEPVWDGGDAEAKLEGRFPGTYAVMCAESGEVMLRAFVGRSRDELERRRQAPGETMARGSVGLSTQISEAWAEQSASLKEDIRELKLENRAMRIENDNLKEQLMELRLQQSDEVPDELYRLIERGMSMFEGKTMRATVTSRFNRIVPKLIVAIGEAQTVKVAMIVQEEFNAAGGEAAIEESH